MCVVVNMALLVTIMDAGLTPKPKYKKNKFTQHLTYCLCINAYT